MEYSHSRRSLLPVWPGEALVAGSLDIRSTFTSRRAGEVFFRRLAFAALRNFNARCRLHRSPSLRASAKQSRVTAPNTSSQAAARLVGRERGAFFGGGSSRSAGIKTGAQSLHHGHAQPLLSLQNLTDAARRSKDRHHVRTGETMLIHEVADEIRCAWWPPRPLAFLIGCDQTGLRLQPGNVGWLIRLPESFNKGAGASEFRIAIDQVQGCIHHTVSASILSYSLWVPKKRIAKAR